ncbi:MAG: hypothetical protein OXI59_13665, partial [Gemmatimonadota bacterium]|nr:hypothetical protein [Gemmatimonadota bacterium]
MIIVINEWIFHDLLCDNGPQNFRETAAFVIRLDGSSDKIVVAKNEPRWELKADQLQGVSGVVQRTTAQLFLNLFYDANRSIVLLPEDIPATPKGTYDWAPHKDVYLVEACV